MSWFKKYRQSASDGPSLQESPTLLKSITESGPDDGRSGNYAAGTSDITADMTLDGEATAEVSPLPESVASQAQDEVPTIIERPPLAAVLPVAEANVESLQPPWMNLTERLHEVALEQTRLKELFESRLHSDQVQAGAIQQLHQQLQEYKTNFIRQALLPILKDIIHCCDFVAKEIIRADAQPTGQQKDDDSLPHIQQMLLDVLFKYDVEPFFAEGQSFDRQTQHCVELVPTTSSEDDLKVAARRLSGFQSGSTILRKEQVSVYKLIATS